MKIRWLVTYITKTGFQHERRLQIWDDNAARWTTIETTVCREETEEDYSTTLDCPHTDITVKEE